jgi:hypothetical protein
MPRPPHHPSHDALESDDSAATSGGGLADVLEPDPDAITSMHRLAPASRRSGSLRARAAAPISMRSPAPVQVQDFAFADTVFANELTDDEGAPPSGPIYVHEPGGHTQCVTPLSFPLPPAGADVDFPTRLRVLHAHLRHALRRARDEMREIWAGAAEMVVERERAEGAEPPALPFVVRRVLALWSCFQWSRADLTRAAMIGLAVFVAAAAIGATTMDFGESARASAGASSEVRSGRTLDQHTGKKLVAHPKR